MQHDLKVEHPYVTYVVMEEVRTGLFDGDPVTPQNLGESANAKYRAIVAKVLRERVACKGHFILEPRVRPLLWTTRA